MLLTNIEHIPGKKITNHIGLVQGSTVRAKHLGKDIGAFFKNIIGGELESYSDLMRESREEAIERMADTAKEMGANGVINIRLTTSSISGGAAEMLAYGTAVVLDDE